MAKRKYGRSYSLDNTDASSNKVLIVPTGQSTANTITDFSVRKAHACDRCRLKKIKCDGLKPNCSNCARIDFPCKTSDKLSRRGLPKGYTELLEKEIVRLTNVNASSVVSANSNLPFINDTFYCFDNYNVQSANQRFLGHLTWNILTNTFPTSKSVTFSDESNQNNLQLQLLTSFLNLNGDFNHLPNFLLLKYDYNLQFLKNLLSVIIKDFFKRQNSLLLLLYPSNLWKNLLLDKINSVATTDDPITLLTLLYVIQFTWSCFDDFKLFKVTKIIISLTTNNTLDLRVLQLINLSIFYFMGGSIDSCKDTDPPTANSDVNSIIWTNELLNLNFTHILNMGLYINPKNLIPILNNHNNGKVNEEDDRLVTFWCFQFLNSWWSLIQGLPKSNFLIEEFQPKSISVLEIPKLKPFEILLNFIIDSLDGSNLLKISSLDVSDPNFQFFQNELEGFKKKLLLWNLYHNLNDHENFQFLTSKSNAKLTTNLLLKNIKNLHHKLNQPDFVEIQLTLFYLSLKLITLKEDDQNLKKEDISLEILTLYFLILTDNSNNDDNQQLQPQQLNLYHFTPFNSNDIINLCLSNLNSWSIISHKYEQDQNQLQLNKTKFQKFQNFLNYWCSIWYYDEYTTNSFLQILKLNFNLLDFKLIHLSEQELPLLISLNKLRYLHSVSNFNSNADKTNVTSKIDTQLSLSQHSNGNSNSNFLDRSPYDFNKIFMNNFENYDYETDEGYAEDDDEEDSDSDNSLPLEIPFNKNRIKNKNKSKEIQQRLSLFGNTNNNSVDFNPDANSDPNANLNPNSPSTTSVKKKFLDHIILDNREIINRNGPSKQKYKIQNILNSSF
ncbi:sip4p [Saccharomyces arboricola H-6]|uniref:Sip4p n=1 Tax=Saccharomyces arboricola (strain H-6 / AS 2.3317 / CBS 10644) TaxID=1160507 RepID=J8Q6D5_SACAR|nr:sip4p [Saccharomyces arboricola H-6]